MQMLRDKSLVAMRLEVPGSVWEVRAGHAEPQMWSGAAPRFEPSAAGM